MTFCGIPFLLFAIVFFPAYFVLSRRRRDYFVVAMSCFVYGWWNYKFLALLFTSVCIDFYIGKLIYRADSQSRKKLLLAGSITAQLCILGFFKYFNFFGESFSYLLAAIGLKSDWVTENIVLPVGISFYTFHTMSYTIDIYRRKLVPEPSFLKFAEFVTLWPVLVAGPIIRAARLLPQLNRERKFKWAKLISGGEMIIAGYFLKICVADNLGLMVAQRFNSPDTNSSLSLLIGVFFFAYQIYGDFAGYSFIAIGLGRILGLNFGRNFRRPYLARSFSEIWRRWNISLSSWMQDYVYVSLGGSRHSELRTNLNTMLTMLLVGLWHGASWMFVGWGALHGFYLVLQRLVGRPLYKLSRRLGIPDLLTAIVSGTIVFFFVCLGYVFFRAPNIGSTFLIIKRIVDDGSWSFNGVANRFLVEEGLGLVAIVMIVEALLSLPQTSNRVWQWRAGRVAASIIMIWLISLTGSFSGEQFIYFAF